MVRKETVLSTRQRATIEALEQRKVEIRSQIAEAVRAANAMVASLNAEIAAVKRGERVSAVEERQTWADARSAGTG